MSQRRATTGSVFRLRHSFPGSRLPWCEQPREATMWQGPEGSGQLPPYELVSRGSPAFYACSPRATSGLQPRERPRARTILQHPTETRRDSKRLLLKLLNFRKLCYSAIINMGLKGMHPRTRCEGCQECAAPVQ